MLILRAVFAVVRDGTPFCPALRWLRQGKKERIHDNLGAAVSDSVRTGQIACFQLASDQEVIP